MSSSNHWKPYNLDVPRTTELVLPGLTVVSLLLILILERLGYWAADYISVELPRISLLTLALYFPTLELVRRAPPDSLRRFHDLRANRRVRIAIGAMSMTCLVLVIVLVFSRILRAQWSLIDDHEIMWFLGSDGRLPLTEIPSRLADTEVGAFGATPRYRPTYYFLRLLEASLWGAHPSVWYASRLAMLAMSVFFFWRVMARFLGYVGGALLAAYTLTFTYWAHIFGRLGPSETYAVLGLALFILGTTNELSDADHRPIGRLQSCAAVLAGSILCIGSKENFVFLTVPLLFLLIRAIRTRNIPLISTSALSLVFATYVTSSVAIGTSSTGLDVYAHPTSIPERVFEIARILQQARFKDQFVVLVGATSATGALLLFPQFRKKVRREVLLAASWLLLLSALYMSQWIYYVGTSWPVPSHYDFPVYLYLPAAVLILYWLGKQILRRFQVETEGGLALKSSLIAGLAITIVFYRGFGEIGRILDAQVAESSAFSRFIQQVATNASANQAVAIVIESDSAWDYEPIASYARFLRAYGVDNQLFVRIRGYGAEDYEAGLGRRLTTELQALSEKGGGEFSPLSELEAASGSCLSVILDGQTLEPCTPDG